MTTKKSYTVLEASQKLGISRQAVLKAIRAGRLAAKPTPITKTVLRIPVKALQRFKVSLSHKKRGSKRRA